MRSVFCAPQYPSPAYSPYLSAVGMPGAPPYEYFVHKPSPDIFSGGFLKDKIGKTFGKQWVKTTVFWGFLIQRVCDYS
jgi:hypothetical protein